MLKQTRPWSVLWWVLNDCQNVKMAAAFQRRLHCEPWPKCFSPSGCKTFQECFVFYMQPEVMAEDEVNNVSLCHNDNSVTISNDPRRGHVVVLLPVSCPFACCVSLIFFFVIFFFFASVLKASICFLIGAWKKKKILRPPSTLISGAFKLCHQNQTIMSPVLVVVCFIPPCVSRRLRLF